MNCPSCGSDRIHSDGTRPSGSKRYKCTNCGKKFIPDPKKPGIDPIGDRPMTGYERLVKFRAKKKDSNPQTSADLE